MQLVDPTYMLMTTDVRPPNSIVSGWDYDI